MKIGKASIIKIFLAVALIFSIFVCGYTVINYKGTNQSTYFTMNNRGGGQGFGNNMGSPPNDLQEGRSSNKNSGENDRSLNNQDAGSGSSSVNDNSKESSSDNSLKSRPQWQGGTKGNFMRIGQSSTGSAYSKYFYVYAGVFICVAIGLYYYFIRKKALINPKNEKILILLFFGIGFLLRVALALLIYGHNDMNIFKGWAQSVSSNLTKFYTNTMMSDYPPLYMYVLYVIGNLAKITALNKYYVLLLKLPSIIADVISSYLIFRVSKRYVSSEISLIISIIYLYNPAVFINSTVWGQVDSLFALIIVIALYLLSKNKLVMSSFVFTVAVLMKPQGIIFLPVLFFEHVRQKKLKNFVVSLVVAIVTALIIITPFTSGRDITWIFKLYSSTVSEYPYATVSAFNFFYLMGANYVKDSSIFIFMSYHTWGMLFIVLTTLLSWYIYYKGREAKYVFAAALIQIAGVFTFSVGMHERYLFPAIILSIFAFIKFRDKRMLLISLGYSITIYLNTHLILFNFLGGNEKRGGSEPIGIFVSILNIVLFAYVIKVVFDSFSKKSVIKM
ncbi:glycosyltransferase 87 family protein [Clostridium sp. C8-1-8]|uniref:glycosyltransferase 87 family protein n=1 Tax=Clostridium sp. C8-1-8 TaxID=2698831 RepID=UPI001367B809|nr:glycosyltransferase 87 family protein [Clostridium sp. C8-1-8]